MTYSEARKIVKRKPLWLVRDDYHHMSKSNKNNMSESAKLELLALEIILFDLFQGKN